MARAELTRRQAIAGVALAGSVLAAGRRAIDAAVGPVDVMPGLSILPRDAWGADLPPKGPLYGETPRFLLVHHTESPASPPITQMRITYAWHTSATKGWNDVCYNVFVDLDGNAWEGRAGSLSGPVLADATGGNQGFSQLVCVIGSYMAAPPSAAAQDTLVKVLAWLAVRDGIDPAPGATTRFVSRGSNKWPAGVAVAADMVSGHRDMSYTDCPGDALYALLPELRERVADQHAVWTAGLRRAVRGARYDLG